jgi:hypothetical protein
MATTSNAFLGLFQSSQLERGSTAGFSRCCTVANFVGGGHVDEDLQLVVQILFGLSRRAIQRTIDARRCRSVMRPPKHL